MPARKRQLTATPGVSHTRRKPIGFPVLGTTREVVARLMRDFVAQGFVETGRGVTRIKDAAGLAGLIASPA